jgi:acetyl esterase/lipase
VSKALKTLALGLIVACTSTSATMNLSKTLEPRPPVPGAGPAAHLTYAKASRLQTIEVYRSNKATSPSPVILRLGPGGIGDPAAAAIIDAGYALAVVHYRGATEAPIVAAARDVKAAVRHLRAHASELELDPERFIAWGAADAGWLAVMLGVTGDQKTVFDDPSLGNANVSSEVRVVIDWGGPTDFGNLDRDQAEHASPACSQTYERHGIPGSNDALWVCGDRQLSLGDPSCADAIRDTNLAPYVATAKKLPAFYFAHAGDDCVISIWQTVRVLEALTKREEMPGFHRMSRAVHDDARFQAEETGRSLAFINDVFHPDAGR